VLDQVAEQARDEARRERHRERQPDLRRHALVVRRGRELFFLRDGQFHDRSNRANQR
jgi:hypothetical protein